MPWLAVGQILVHEGRHRGLESVQRSVSRGHWFTFTNLGNETRVDHKLQMTPKAHPCF
jgi:hypothetical protein